MGKKISEKRRFDTQPQLTRLHALVKRIQQGDYPSQTILAAEWEKSSRTIQSDLDFIRDDWGLPLEYDQKRYGYYFSEPVANFPMIPISEQELVSVFVAQKALRPYHGTPFEAPLRSAFEKLVGSLQGEISVQWADLDSAISFRGIETAAEDTGMLAELSGTIRARKEIEFVYWKLGTGAESKVLGLKSKVGSESKVLGPESKVLGPQSEVLGLKSKVLGPESKVQSRSQRLLDQNNTREANTLASSSPTGEIRRVRPYHLACIGGQWYLFGYDLMREDIRKFVPARMKDLRVLETRFERPTNFSVDKQLKGSFGVFSGGELMTMKIRFDAFAGRLVKEKRWHHSQEVRELRNGEIEVAFELSSFVEIVPWILSWEDHAQAVAPKGLVAEVAGVVARLGKRYGKVT